MSDRKYSFCIHVPGEMDNGINSTLRGEGRWTLNIGVVLAEHGHDVTIIGNPGRGAIPNCKHVTWGSVDRNRRYDFFLDGTWFEACAQRNMAVPANAYIRCFWGVDHQYNTIRTDYDHKHFCAYPSLEVYGKVKSHPNAKYGHFLPIPIIREFESRNNFGCPYLMWPTKTAFEFEHKVGLSEFVLTSMLDLCEEKNLAPIVLFDAHHKATHRWAKHTPSHIDSRVASFPGKRHFAEGTSHGEVLTLLSETKVMFNNGAPPASPMFVEAVAKGCVPLVWPSALFNDVPKKYGLDFAPHNGEHFFRQKEYFTNEVTPKIRQLVEDEDFYTEVLQAYRKEVEHHAYNKAYETLMESFVEVIKRVEEGA